MNFLEPLLSSLRNPGKTKNVVKTAFSEPVSERINSYFTDGQASGTSCHIDLLHPHFRWRDGFLYAFSGYPGSGKSTFLNYLMVLRAIHEGRKTALYSPESYPVEDLVEELIRMHAGGNVSAGYNTQISPAQFAASKKFIGEHFYFLDFEDIPSIQDVLAEFEKLIITEGVGMVIIDPFNSIAEGADESGSGNLSQYLKAALTQSKMFAVSHDIPVCLIEHPRSTGTLKKGEARPDPSPMMVYGGSMWWNKVDVFATVDRDQTPGINTELVTFRTWKIKKQRLMGNPGLIELRYDTMKAWYSAEAHDQFTEEE